MMGVKREKKRDAGRLDRVQSMLYLYCMVPASLLLKQSYPKAKTGSSAVEGMTDRNLITARPMIERDFTRTQYT